MPLNSEFNISSKPFIYIWRRVSGEEGWPEGPPCLALAWLWMFPPNLQPTVPPRRTPLHPSFYWKRLYKGVESFGLPTCVCSLIVHLLTSRSRPWETDRLETNSNSHFSLGFMQNPLVSETTQSNCLIWGNLFSAGPYIMSRASASATSPSSMQVVPARYQYKYQYHC